MNLGRDDLQGSEVNILHSSNLLQHIWVTVIFERPLSVVLFHPSSRASCKSFNIDDPNCQITSPASHLTTEIFPFAI